MNKQVEPFEYKTIHFQSADNIAQITLSRPIKLNALNDTMLEELLACLQHVANNPEIKSLIITGAGDRAFCIGSDVSFLNEAFATRNFKQFNTYLNKVNSVFFALENLPIPVVAMVQGNARAGGFELILACDFVIVAETVQIGDVHTPFGHVPGGVCQRLSRKIGSQKAMDLVMSGRWISGSEALDLGIAIHSVPTASLAEFTYKYVTENFIDKNRECLAYVKKNIVTGYDLPLRNAVQFEIQNYIEFLATSDEPAWTFFKNQEERLARKKAPAGNA
jgi:2-(1,2-epoxy-1,2-dihydrophenyl)acetyl-CoA isomerase/putative hydratase